MLRDILALLRDCKRKRAIIKTLVVCQGPVRVSEIMRCAKGIFAKGILGCTGFSLLRWGEGSETPPCGGEKGVSDSLVP